MNFSVNATRPVEWARRINGRWIVHRGLREQAEAWMRYLEAHDPGRLHDACVVAQEMCEHREAEEDPKPWFYSGLFSVATPVEARRFLASHRLTAASVPALADDEEVERWSTSVCGETMALVERLREALRGCLE